MSDANRQWRLRSRPVGWVKESDFELHSEPIPKPGPGQVLVRNLYLAFEPAMRGWIEDRPSYMPPVGIGEVMRGMTVGRVEASNLEALRPGALVQTMSGWQEWAVADAGVTRLPPGVDPTLALSVLGATGITAYFGILDVGQVKSGETVLVSGAAGATGSVAGQIARLVGARAIGIAGGAEKCGWLTSEASFDGAIDYKSEDVAARLDALCPNGIDVYFDNVGGPTLDLVLARMRHGARIVLCGAISRYNEKELPPGPRNYFELTIKSARMQGFIVLDYLRRFPEAQEKLLAWVAEGKIAWKVDVQHGFETAPRTFLRLFRGENFGKQLLEI
jgi:NADPH-dependent curcumin reductase CurA